MNPRETRRIVRAMSVIRAAKQANTECRSGDRQWKYNIAPAIVRDMVAGGLVTVADAIRWRYESKVRGAPGWRKLKSPVPIKVQIIEEV